MSYERSLLLDAENPPGHDEAELEALDELDADLAYERMRDQRDERASALFIAVSEYQRASNDAFALNEIGEVVPRKEVIDVGRLTRLIDGMGHDLPGVELVETEYLTVTAMKS